MLLGSAGYGLLMNFEAAHGQYDLTRNTDASISSASYNMEALVSDHSRPVPTRFTPISGGMRAPNMTGLALHPSNI